MSVYGFTGNGRLADNKRNDALLQDALLVAAELGDVPVLVMGDFNIVAEQSATLAAAARTGRWTDLGAAAAAARGEEPPATCFARGRESQGSRIDYILANHVALQAFTSIDLVPDTGIPTHTPIQVLLDLPAFEQHIHRVLRPLAFPVDQWTPQATDDEDDLARKLWTPFQLAWDKASRDNDVNLLWRLFGDGAESYMAHRSAPLEHPLPRYRGRGQDRSPKSGPLVASERRGVQGALPTLQLRLLKLLRRFEKYARWQHSFLGGTAPYQVLCLWTTIRKDAATLLDATLHWSSALRRVTLPNSAEVEQALQGLRGLFERQLAEQRHHRRHTWSMWVQQAWHSHPGRLYKYTKGEHPASAPLLRRVDGTSTANATDMDEILQKAWAPIFRIYADKPEPDWTAFYVRFRAYITSVPMELSDLTGQDLATTLAHQSAKSAAGMDGWRVGELKRLPPFFC